MSDTEQPSENQPGKSETEHIADRASIDDTKRIPFWKDRTLIVSVVGIVVALLIYNWQKPGKALSCDIVAVGPLVSVTDDVNKRVRISFDNVPVTDAQFAIIKVTNPGNVPIAKTDFDRPLTLYFGAAGHGKILTAQLLTTHPNNIGATFTVRGNALTLNPLLLNPDDAITFKIFYTGVSGNPDIDARISGVSEITAIDSTKSRKAAQLGFWLGEITSIVIGVITVILANMLYSRLLSQSKEARALSREALDIAKDQQKMIDLQNKMVDAQKEIIKLKEDYINIQTALLTDFQTRTDKFSP